MYFKLALAAGTVALAATSDIRFAGRIEGQQSNDIASLHKLHITEGMQVRKRQVFVAVYSPELVDNYASTQASLQQTRVSLTTKQLRLFRHQKLYGLNAQYCS